MEELKSFVDGFFEELIFQKNLNADLLLSGYIRVNFNYIKFSKFLKLSKYLNKFFNFQKYSNVNLYILIRTFT